MSERKAPSQSLAHSATRRAELTRATKETDITASVDLDGSGKAEISTGVGFFDHMLEALAKHAVMDVTVKATGDLHVDAHHTVEDVGIVLGQCVKQALGDMTGIRRFGHAYVPMDEALSRCSIDLSNRPFLVWNAVMPTPLVGVGSGPAFDTQLAREWFQAFAMNAGACVHVDNLRGDNTHHIIESCFKALARALRVAVEPDPRMAGASPSTKGVL